MPNKHYDSQWRKVPNNHYDESKNSGAAPTYDWRHHFGMGGNSTISGAASTISQSVNRGASDVLEPKFDAAHPETDGLP